MIPNYEKANQDRDTDRDKDRERYRERDGLNEYKEEKDNKESDTDEILKS
jgi:hypothetical protein